MLSWFKRLFKRKPKPYVPDIRLIVENLLLADEKSFVMLAPKDFTCLVDNFKPGHLYKTTCRRDVFHVFDPHANIVIFKDVTVEWHPFMRDGHCLFIPKEGEVEYQKA